MSKRGLFEDCTMLFKAVTLDETVKVDYTNYKGEREIRTITPISVDWGSNTWHPDPQFLLVCWCHRAKAPRIFALRDIHAWGVK